MQSTSPITLQLTANNIDHYCQELARSSPSPEKRVAALDAIITFLSSQADAGIQATAEFQGIKHTLLTHFEQAREALLHERAQRLLQALQARHLPHIALVYSALSRDAFWSLLGRIEQHLEATALQTLRDWATDWLLEAKRRAQQASRYPDTLDFKAAGIDATEYLAMNDLCRYLGTQDHPST